MQAALNTIYQYAALLASCPWCLHTIILIISSLWTPKKAISLESYWGGHQKEQRQRQNDRANLPAAKDSLSVEAGMMALSHWGRNIHDIVSPHAYRTYNTHRTHRRVMIALLWCHFFYNCSDGNFFVSPRIRPSQCQEIHPLYRRKDEISSAPVKCFLLRIPR